MLTSKNRQLAAILFADIVGYTSLMQQGELEAMTTLNRFQSTIKTTTESYDGEVVKSYGDGSLLLFSSTVNAVECAQDIQIEFAETPKVPVRIGIHVGEFVRKENDVFGNGINIAARIESIGVAGSVLFSEDVAKRIKNHPEFETVSLGKIKFKNVEEKIQVFALANDGCTVPNRSDLKGDIVASFKNKKWLFPTILGVLLLVILGLWQFSSQENISTPQNTTLSKSTSQKTANSLAVLPFANLSSDQENDYFSDGIHDDLLSHLSKIGDMKVISRTSVLRFKDTQKPISEIAEMLGVANIVEGSIRRAGNKVRINVQLIEAKTEDHIWSEIYDRALTANNIFDIQTEIAKKVAIALQTNISTTQQVALDIKPTQNLAAYEAYLRGRQLVEERVGKSILEAKEYLEQAIELDPNFAEAYVKLGEVYYLLVEYASADSHTNYPIAWQYCEKAKAINPNLAAVYGLEGTLNHYDKGNMELAQQAFEKAISLNPNYADAYFWYSHAVFEIKKDNKKALDILENAMQLNPLSPKFINRLAQTYVAVGDFDKAIAAYHKGIDLAPNHIFLPRNLSFLYGHANKLDSAAITAYETIARNSTAPKFLRTYIFTLAQLDLSTEIAAEMSQFRKETRLDSLFYFKLMQNEALRQGKFEDAEKYLNLLTNLDKDAQSHDPTLALNIYYYKKDFQKMAAIFERNYPNLLEENYFKNTMFSGYNRQLALQEGLQKYIYSLTQIGQSEKAQQLFDKYKNHIIANVNPTGDSAWEIKKRDLFKIKNLIIDGQSDKAMDQFADYFDGKIMAFWHDLLIDPIFDAFKQDTRYLTTINALKTEIDRQSISFQAYLLKKH